MMVTLHSPAVIWAVPMAAVGFALGLAYFAALRAACTRLLAGRRGTLVLTGARFAAVVVLLILAAHRGAAALLALFAGFLLARSFAVGRARRQGVGGPPAVGAPTVPVRDAWRAGSGRH